MLQAYFALPFPELVYIFKFRNAIAYYEPVITHRVVILLLGTSRAKHRAGVSAIQLPRMAFPLLDEVEMAASSRQIGPTAPWNATCHAR